MLRGLGGRLPTLFALNQGVLEASLGLVTTTEALRARAAASFGAPILRLPLPFVAPPALPDREAARAALDLSPDRRVVAAVRPAGTGDPAGVIVRALDAVRAGAPLAAVVWTREDDPALATALGAADLVVALEDPVRCGLGRAIPMAVAAGRPALVTAGSGAAREMPEGVVGRVSPGPTEGDEIFALVRRLLADEPLRETMGRLARSFAAARCDPPRCARELLSLVEAVRGAREAVERRLPGPDETARLATEALRELRWVARELSLVDLPSGVPSLVVSLFGGREG